MAGRAAPDDVVDGAEAGHHRSRRRRRVRRARCGTERRLAALYLLTVADIRGTSPQGVERVEGEAARGPVPRARGAARRDARRAARCRTASTRGRPRRMRQLRLYAVPDGAEQSAVAAARQRCISSATPPTRSRGTRDICTTASIRREPVVKARLSRDGEGLQVCLPARPEGALRAHLRLLRARSCRSSRRRSTRRATATRSTPSRCTIRPTRTPAYRDSHQLRRVRAAKRAADRAAAAASRRPSAASAATSSISR